MFFSQVQFNNKNYLTFARHCEEVHCCCVWNQTPCSFVWLKSACVCTFARFWQTCWYLSPLCFLLPSLSYEAQTSFSACLPMTNGGLWSLGARRRIRCVTALGAIGSGGSRLRGRQERRYGTSLDWRMNVFTWEEEEEKNWLHCFLQPAAASQCIIPKHTSWKWI